MRPIVAPLALSPLLVPVIASLLAFATAAPAAAGSLALQPAVAPDDSVPITEWDVPWARSRPRDPAVDAQGRVWFVGQEGNYIAYLEPARGTFRRYELDPGTNPHNLVVDAKGQVWFAGNRNAMIGRLDPATGKIDRFPMPDAAARDPHTLVFDRTGDLWFTVQGGNFVGRLRPATGKIDLVRVATPNARPYGIAVDSRGRVWFNEFGAPKIASIDPGTLEIREWPLPHERARGRRLAITRDDRVWYVDYTRGKLAVLDPATGAIREWPLPAGAGALPYGMTVDDRDRLWLVETGVQPNRLVGFDAGAERVIADVPIARSGGGTVRYMIFHRPTRALWFGTDANTIARALVPEATAAPTLRP